MTPAPPSRGSALHAAGSLMVAGGILAGSVLLVVAMIGYPGGNVVDLAAHGHSFWFNFLCDLTNDVALNGRPNSASAAAARAGVLALAGALVAFWLTVPMCFVRGGGSYGHLVRALGLTSVAGVVLVPGATGAMHRVAVLASCVPALAAGLLTVGALARAARLARSRSLWALASLGGGVVALTLAAAVLYARTFMHLPRVVPGAVPLAQRMATVSLLIWMGAVAAQVWRDRMAAGLGLGRAGGASRKRNGIRSRGPSAGAEDDRDRPPASREAAR